jgi:hypothetical protein
VKLSSYRFQNRLVAPLTAFARAVAAPLLLALEPYKKEGQPKKNILQQTDNLET